MDLRREQVVWFAGLFEGEGYIGVQRRYGRNQRLRMELGSIDRDVLEHIQELFGGAIRLQKSRQDHWQPFWRWSLSGTHSTYAVAVAIWPFLGQRRRMQVAGAVKLMLADPPKVSVQHRTRCPAGHIYDAVDNRGARICTRCRRDARQRWQEGQQQ